MWLTTAHSFCHVCLYHTLSLTILTNLHVQSEALCCLASKLRISPVMCSSIYFSIFFPEAKCYNILTTAVQRKTLQFQFKLLIRQILHLYSHLCFEFWEPEVMPLNVWQTAQNPKIFSLLCVSLHKRRKISTCLCLRSLNHQIFCIFAYKLNKFIQI